MNGLKIAAECVIPYILYMLLGFFARKTGVADRKFLTNLNKVIFSIFFPVMMFTNVSTGEFSFGSDTGFLIFVLLSLVGVFLLSLWLIPKIVKNQTRDGVIVQAIFRSNVLLFAVELTETLFGQEQTALAVLVCAAMVPVYNVLAVIDFEWFSGSEIHPGSLILSILKNPLIIGTLAGALFLVLRIPLPETVEDSFSVISSLCSPLGMFALGGLLEFRQLKKDWKTILSVSLIRMVLLPALLLGIGTLLGFSNVQKFLLMILYAVPVSINSVAMAQNLKGDGALAGELTVTTTVLSIGSLFIWITLLPVLGII